MIDDEASAEEQTSGARRVLVVDDHPVVALGMDLAFRAIDDLTIVGIAASPDDAVDLFASQTPDAVVLDLVFSGHVRFSLVRQARTAFPDAVIVVFTSLPARLYRREAIEAGADAYLTKDNDLSSLILLLRTLFENAASLDRSSRRETCLDPDTVVVATEPSAFGDGMHMTQREVEVAEMLSRGLALGDIASIIGTSSNTVAVHRDNLRRKLGCRDSTELVARLARIYARRDGEG